MKMLRTLFFAGLTMVGVLSLGALGQHSPARTIRAGMIGLDTSHVPAFTRIFNSDQAAGDLAGIKVVAGYPGGTDIPASRDRVGKFTDQLREMEVEIVDTIPELLKKVDVVLLESVDGRIHLQEAIPVIKAGKPLWIDKPVAGSLADAIVIYELAKKHNVPCFSTSSARFSAGLRLVLNDEKVGSVAGRIDLGLVLLFARHARHVLLRHSRHRAAVRADGQRLRNGQSRAHGRHRLCHRRVEGGPHRHLSRHSARGGLVWRHRVRQQGHCGATQRAAGATKRSARKSRASSRRANRR